MKKAILALAIIIAAAGTTASFAQSSTTAEKNQKKTAKAKTYTCPMHPEVSSTKKGKCPKCGMKLELAKAEKRK